MPPRSHLRSSLVFLSGVLLLAGTTACASRVRRRPRPQPQPHQMQPAWTQVRDLPRAHGTPGATADPGAWRVVEAPAQPKEATELPSLPVSETRVVLVMPINDLVRDATGSVRPGAAEEIAESLRGHLTEGSIRVVGTQLVCHVWRHERTAIERALALRRTGLSGAQVAGPAPAGVPMLREVPIPALPSEPAVGTTPTERAPGGPHYLLRYYDVADLVGDEDAETAKAAMTELLDGLRAHLSEEGQLESTDRILIVRDTQDTLDRIDTALRERRAQR